MKVEYALHFYLGPSPEQIMRVRFESDADQRAYVQAEYSAVALYYRKFCASFSKDERVRAKMELEQARWTFYNKWLNKFSLQKVIG